MSGSESSSLPLPARPSIDDRDAWRIYWQQLGQPWRTEPEINEERQKDLAERCEIAPDIEKGIYPFKNIKLSRADVEWLLATHEHGRGPVDWAKEQDRERSGLDMRGADFRQTDLRGLPLANLIGGLDYYEHQDATEEHIKEAAVHMEGGVLYGAQLQGANLAGAQLEGANFYEAQLEGANLREAHLEGTNLVMTQLRRAILAQAQLEKANFRGAQLERADLREAHLEGANLKNIKLGDWRRIGPRVADTQWCDANLAVVDWSQVTKLGDEWEAEQRKARNRKKKEKQTRLEEYQAVVRANRQLAVALRSQGLDEDAARFAYCAQKCQRILLHLQRKYIQYLFSQLLDLLAGFGYRPIRTVFWYLLVVGGFAAAYALFGHLSALPDALVYSLTSFHGRGFFPGLGKDITLHNPLVILAAAEAVIGLFIEISFIATFTQRYFGK